MPLLQDPAARIELVEGETDVLGARRWVEQLLYEWEVATQDSDDMEAAVWDQLTAGQERIIALHDAAIELSPGFLETLDISSFDPRAPEPATRSHERRMVFAVVRDVNAVLTLTLDVGPGITRYQFQSAMRRCALCMCFCFKGRQECHRCPGRVCRVWKGNPVDMANYLLSREPNAGMSTMDLRRLLVACGMCGNVCTTRRLALHICRSN
ncbi:hypothetical protein NMY22_g9992 [Coprinellus aureogranulatus]|nr:hypothetical protein NMY22_g9992 [Coprinellus aureogranulatus]